MGKASRRPIFILGGMLLVTLGMSVPSMSFGERVSPGPVGDNTTQTQHSSTEMKEEAVSFPSGSTGFRSEESERERTSDSPVPQPRALSKEDQELVETTDASGGTMINLQGRFQCGLKVPHESRDIPVEEALSPAAP